MWEEPIQTFVGLALLHMKLVSVLPICLLDAVAYGSSSSEEMDPVWYRGRTRGMNSSWIVVVQTLYRPLE